MPIPSLDDTIIQVDEVSTDLGAVTTALAALPATPLEADLPDIVAIVSDLNSAATSLQAVVASMLTVLSTTRINQ